MDLHSVSPSAGGTVLWTFQTGPVSQALQLINHIPFVLSSRG
jgi:hypothetical protein